MNVSTQKKKKNLLLPLLQTSENEKNKNKKTKNLAMVGLEGPLPAQKVASRAPRLFKKSSQS